MQNTTIRNIAILLGCSLLVAAIIYYLWDFISPILALVIGVVLVGAAIGLFTDDLPGKIYKLKDIFRGKAPEEQEEGKSEE